MKLFKSITFGIAGLALVACGQSSNQPTGGGAEAGCMSRAYDTIGGPFNLTTHTGERVTEADFKGKPTLIFFGFTYCYEACPPTLHAIKHAYEALPEGIEQPQTLFVSFDPDRDTPEVLASYVTTKAYPDNLIGLTGTPEEIAAVAAAFIVQYERVEQPESVAEYIFDHSTLLYLMDENWELQTFFAEIDKRPEYMAECLAQHLG